MLIGIAVTAPKLTVFCDGIDIDLVKNMDPFLKLIESQTQIWKLKRDLIVPLNLSHAAIYTQFDTSNITTVVRCEK
jgi:hypothetical protein